MMFKKLFFVCAFLLIASNAWAATRTWDGGGANDNASTKENWSDDTAPTTGDTAVFDGTSDDNCTWDITAVLGVFNAGSADYDGTITLGSNLNVGGNITLPDAGAGWTPSTYTVTVSNTATITTNGKEFYGLSLTKNATYTLADDVTVNGTFTAYSGSGVTTINGNTLHLKGTVTGNALSSGTTGTTIFSIDGSGDQNVDFVTNATAYSYANPVNIASTGGTVYFTNSVSRLGNKLTKTSGTVDFITNTSTVEFWGTTSRNVLSATFYKLCFFTQNATITLDGDITVNNEFKSGSGSGVITFNSNHFHFKGDVLPNQANNSSGTSGTTEWHIDGTGTQTVNFDTYLTTTYFYGNPIFIENSGTVNFSDVGHSITGNITFNGTGTYNLANTIYYKTGTLTYTAGTVSAGTSTLSIQGSCALNTDGIDWYNITHAATNTTTLSSALTATNTYSLNYATTFSGNYAISTKDLTIGYAGTKTLVGNITATGTTTLNNNSGSNFAINGAQINAQGDVTTAISNGYSVTGTTVLNISGSGNQAITLQSDYAGGYPITIPVTIASTGGTVTFANVTHNLGGGITYTSGTVAMGSSTVYCTRTANFNGGTIPFNNLTFGGQGAVTVTMTGNVLVGGTCTISSVGGASTLALGSNTLTVQGDVVNNGTISGAGTISVSGGTNATQTFSGNGFTIGSLSCISPAVNKTLTFASTKTYSFSNTVTLISAYGGNSLTVNASTGGSQAKFDIDVEANQVIERAVITDNQETNGWGHNYKGTNNNTTGWDTEGVSTPATTAWAWAG